MKSDRGEVGLPASAVGSAVAIAIVWGFNFVVIKIGVKEIPPLLLAALRFAFSAFPFLLFIKKPRVGWGRLAAYGLFLGVGEFGLLFTALKLGAPVGLSSIVLQSQAFFTALLAAPLLREKLRARTLTGMGIAALGLILTVLPDAGSTIGAFPPVLALMVVLAALGWAAANVTARTMPATDALGLMVWSSLFSPLPLLGLSLLLEGPPAVLAAVAGMSALGAGALAYLVIMSTLFGYGLWNRLIMRHGAARIAPFSLLVPLFSLSSAALFLGERFSLLDVAAGGLILAGLLTHLFGPSGRIPSSPDRHPSGGGAEPGS